MAITPISAAAFYQAAKPATKTADVTPGPSQAFGKLAQEFTDTLQVGENTAKDAMTGNADLPTLIEALSSSELAVQMAVTVRDKVVDAYQEILRMPV